jgi:hypothetical protein
MPPCGYPSAAFEVFLPEELGMNLSIPHMLVGNQLHKDKEAIPCCCHTCSCAKKSIINRHGGDNPIPLFWIYPICC